MSKSLKRKAILESMRDMNISYKGKSLGDVRSFIRMYYKCSTYIANEVAKQLIIEQR